MQLSFEQAMQLIELLILVIAMILIHRSVPAAQVQKLLDALERAAKTTTTPIDDQAVSAGRLLTTLFTGQAPGLVTAPSAPPATPAPPLPADTPTELGSAG